MQYPGLIYMTAQQLLFIGQYYLLAQQTIKVSSIVEKRKTHSTQIKMCINKVNDFILFSGYTHPPSSVVWSGLWRKRRRFVLFLGHSRCPVEYQPTLSYKTESDMKKGNVYMLAHTAIKCKCINKMSYAVHGLQPGAFSLGSLQHNQNPLT